MLTVCSGAQCHWSFWGGSTGDRCFLSQRTSNAETVSIRWRHHVALQWNRNVIPSVNSFHIIVITLSPLHYGFMMTSSNGTIVRVTGHLCGEFTGPGEFPAQRSVTPSFDVFFDLRLNKRLSKQSRGWWFDTLSCPLWRQCNVVELNVPRQ